MRGVDNGRRDAMVDSCQKGTTGSTQRKPRDKWSQVQSTGLAMSYEAKGLIAFQDSRCRGATLVPRLVGERGRPDLSHEARECSCLRWNRDDVVVATRDAAGKSTAWSLHGTCVCLGTECIVSPSVTYQNHAYIDVGRDTLRSAKPDGRWLRRWGWEH